MKKNIREKFTNNFVVSPLYKKVKETRNFGTRKDFVYNVGSTIKLCGHEITVKRDFYQNFGENETTFDLPVNSDSKDDSTVDLTINSDYKHDLKVKLPGACDNALKSDYKKCVLKTVRLPIQITRSRDVYGVCMEKTGGSNMEDAGNGNPEADAEALASSKVDDAVIIHQVPDTWLRVYPSPKAKRETTFSVIFRCVFCQLGLASFLVLWNLIWVFVIQSYEGPYEVKVSSDFLREQNKLVIDLATELRQITPISERWRSAIEARIDDERRLTTQAVGSGARLHPGHFWDLSGTFLFIIYVMTALGFGAPVPQTVNGRTSTIIYAALAVPTHIYLMVNASTCVIVHIDHCIGDTKSCLREKAPFLIGDVAQQAPGILIGSHDCSRNSDVLKTKRSCRSKISCILSFITIGRCVPLCSVFYYTLGALCFGWMRGKKPLEIVMFPLEFTTTGGLENVQCHIRIMYGLYVEGAMCLLALGLAAIRRHSGQAAATLSNKYRLFASEQCIDRTRK